MSVTDIVCGAVTSSSFWVRGKVTGSSVRLAVSASEDLSSPTYFGPSAPTAQDVASVEATGLSPNTVYWYAFEDDAVLDTSMKGKVRTHPTIGTAHSFTACFAACADGRYDADAGSIYSNSEVFQTIADHDATIDGGLLFYQNMGDFGYPDITVNDPDLYRAMYDANYQASNQSALYRTCAFNYVWDDHDYGDNNSFGTHASKDAAQTVYRERAPHYTLPAGSGTDPIYHSFQVGRVLFIVTDLRSERADPTDTDDASKSMMGATQKTWFKNLFDTTDAAAVIWVCSSPWIAQPVGTEPANVDCWAEFTTERDELVADSILPYMQRGAFAIVAGDIHTLAIDDGSNNEWGGFPVFQFAALDGQMNYRGGPYSHGRSPGIGRYGLIEVEDDGEGIRITGTGYVGQHAWRHHSFGFFPGVGWRRQNGVWVSG